MSYKENTPNGWIEASQRLLAVALIGLLAACGGGGGSDATGASTSSTVLIDSFGNSVGSDGGSGSDGGFAGSDAGGDGTAGDGAPIPNAQVVFVDAAGKTVTTTTDAQGYYRAKLTGFSAPLVAYVMRADGVRRYSVITQSPVSGKFITINMSGLTDKIASDVAVAGGKTSPSELTPAIVAANATVIDTSLSAMRITLAGAIANAGLIPEIFDPLKTPFRANRSGYDNVLDNTVVTKSANGATQIAQAAVLVAPAAIAGIDKYVGTWVTNCLTNAGDTTQSGKYKLVYVKSASNTLTGTASAVVYVGNTCSGTAAPSTAFQTQTGLATYVDTVADGRDRFESTNGKTVSKIVGNILYAASVVGGNDYDAQGYPNNLTSEIYWIRQ